MSLIRLDKLLASQNIGSRKDVTRLIRKGFVTVNNEVVKSPDSKIEPEDNIVAVNGEVVEYKEHVYIMMNKPKGVVSATDDGRDKTVIDILPEMFYRRKLFPAGRLDKDTTGLLIITNDGDFAHKMLSPKSNVYKTYEAKLEKPLKETDVESFEQGIKYAGEEYAPAKLFKKKQAGEEIAIVKIKEGKFHQVKNMFEACDNKVLELRRVAIGNLKLDDSLALGEVKYMTNEEKSSVF